MGRLAKDAAAALVGILIIAAVMFAGLTGEVPW